MAAFDPYATLGVGRTATAGAVKTAYRTLVQTAHPDRGGDPELFITIVRAFDLLSDPEARKLYDETGAFDADAVADFRRDVTKVLADMFDAAVQTAVATKLDLSKVDFVQQMTAAVRNGLTEANLTLRHRPAYRGARPSRQTHQPARRRPNLGERVAAQTPPDAERLGARRRVLLLETALVGSAITARM